ncbi:MAG: NUDIX domain-containing protein [Candidatus Magasanikbacteria bacterium]
MESSTWENMAAGPVIIENGKILLDREMKDNAITPWFFPGGGAEERDLNPEETCKREAREELSIEIEIIRQLKTIKTVHKNKEIILKHFLAKRTGEIKPGLDIADWGWFDINNLPENCAQNVLEIINDIKKEI